ncbi:MAG: hypothetical protein NTX44_07040 [Ignavibacteriales bacterium]|nr:hypothetical protein [Ignavibacteriales bacterium]
MNIAICGLISNHFHLFNGLESYLHKNGHTVYYFEPDYTGGVCLFNSGKPYTTSQCYPQKGSYTPSSLEDMLGYELSLIQYETKDSNKRIKRTKILQINARQKAFFYKSVFTRFKIDLIIVWGGINFNTAVAVSVAREMNKKTILLEKGLYPRTLQVDTEGVNTLNSQKYKFREFIQCPNNYSLEYYQNRVLEKWEFQQPLDSVSWKNKVLYLLKEEQYKDLLSRIADRIIFSKKEKIFSFKPEYHLTDPTNTHSDNHFPSQFLFVPMQVSDDSQVLSHGKWIMNNEGLIDAVLNAVCRTGLDIPIVVKPHPSEYRRIDYQHLKEKYSTIYFSNAGTVDIIKKSSMVVTINSTVGFEATLFRKPVVVLGDALYSMSDIINKAANESELAVQIQKNNGVMLPAQDVERFAACAMNINVPCDFVDPQLEQIEFLWRYIVNLISGS